MRHRKHTFKLGRTSAHRKVLLSSQVCSLINIGEIRTTVEKAKETRRLMDRMITFAKKGDLHHRRLAVERLRDNDAVKKLFAEIAPKFAERKGGYTRIIRLGGKRSGDAAEICILQLTGEQLSAPEAKKKKSPEKKEQKKEKQESVKS